METSAQGFSQKRVINKRVMGALADRDAVWTRVLPRRAQRSRSTPAARASQLGRAIDSPSAAGQADEETADGDDVFAVAAVMTGKRHVEP
jgi:hypothetical protein